MKSIRYPHLAAAVLAVALGGPAAAQDAPVPEMAPEAPVTPAAPPAAEAPAPSGAAPAAGAGAAPAAAPQPEIDVTQQGDWEVGCLAGTTNCEMQQVAQDPEGNPVLLVRLVKLPAGSDAPALAIFNTPLGTLLPPGLGFQIDSSPAAALPFEWCVQEGCIVRLGLRDPDLDAMKRGRTVRLTVTSIADPQEPVALELSLAGFTAGYDSLTAPEAPPAPANPAAPAAPAPAPLAPAPLAPAPQD